MRALVMGHATNPLAAYALQPDKTYFFSRAGHAALAYRVASGVAIVAGDSIGARASWEAIIGEFLAYCRTQDWQPAFYQVCPAALPLYRRYGFQALKVGEDAVLDLQGFSLAGKARANVRHAVTHAERAGLSALFYEGAVADPTVRDQLEQISTVWLRDKAMAETSFSLGSFADVGSADMLVAVARDAGGTVWAFATFRPLPAARAWTLDLMRRRQDAPNGAMELLIARTATYLRQRGAATLSLGTAPLASTHAEPAEPALLARARDFLFENMGFLYSYKSLFFKRKFAPRWEERYLLYQGPAQLPEVILALVRVHVACLAIPHQPAGRAAASLLGRPAPSRHYRPGDSRTMAPRRKEESTMCRSRLSSWRRHEWRGLRSPLACLSLIIVLLALTGSGATATPGVPAPPRLPAGLRQPRCPAPPSMGSPVPMRSICPPAIGRLSMPWSAIQCSTCCMARQGWPRTGCAAGGPRRPPMRSSTVGASCP